MGIKILVVGLIVLCIICLIIVLGWIVSLPLPLMRRIVESLRSSGISLNSFFNVTIIFIMVLAVTMSMLSSIQQVSKMQKQIDKIEEQIQTIKTETDRQIRSSERRANAKRKQWMRSLIKEFKHNLALYKELVDEVERDRFSQQFKNFITVSMEKCLSDSPMDDDKLNHNVLKLYYMIRVHDNKITATRTPNISENSLKGFLNTVVSDYRKNEELLVKVLKMLEKYEQGIQLPPEKKAGNSVGQQSFE